MKQFLVIVFICFYSILFSQDTTIHNKDIYIYRNGKISEKIFKSSPNLIRVVYIYDDCGLLIYRKWYNKDGELLSVAVGD